MLLKKIKQCSLLLISTLLLVACNDTNKPLEDGLSLLETEVFYMQKIALPEGAKLEVRLEDVSKMDVAAELIGSATREIKNSPPYALQVVFPSAQIKEGHRYSLRATISVEGKLQYISTTHINPFEVGIATPIKIKVDPVGG